MAEPLHMHRTSACNTVMTAVAVKETMSCNKLLVIGQRTIRYHGSRCSRIGAFSHSMRDKRVLEQGAGSYHARLHRIVAPHQQMSHLQIKQPKSNRAWNKWCTTPSIACEGCTLLSFKAQESHGKLHTLVPSQPICTPHLPC